jgi:hypothetical protein
MPESFASFAELVVVKAKDQPLWQAFLRAYGKAERGCSLRPKGSQAGPKASVEVAERMAPYLENVLGSMRALGS